MKQLLLLVFVLLAGPGHAGDPLFRTETGEGVGWNPAAPVPVYLFDGGMPQLSPDQIRTETQEAIRLWGSIPGSGLNLKFEGVLPGPLTASSYKSAIYKYPERPYDATPVREAILIIPDRDGSILEDAHHGSSEGVLGMTLPIRGSASLYLRCAVIFLNGRKLTPASLPLTLRHEMGHALGLAHMESNVDCGQLVPRADDPACRDIPLMRRGMLRTPHPDFTLDDMSSLASLYPTPSWRGETGIVEGRLTLRSTGEPVFGAIVVARNLQDPRKLAVSSITASSFNRTGLYRIEGLPAGEYRIDVSPIVSTEGSYGDRVGDVSSPFPKLKTPSLFLAKTPEGEIPLSTFRLSVDGGSRTTVDLVQEDVQGFVPGAPRILSSAGLLWDDVLYVQMEMENPNGEPLALWERRLNATGEHLNPGVWLWDQSNSLGQTKPILHMTFKSDDTIWLNETRSLQVLLAGTGQYSRLMNDLSVIPADQFHIVPVVVNPVVGDLDGSGEFGLSDAVVALRSLVGLETLTMKQRMLADAFPQPGAQGRPFGDGRVEVADVVSMLRRLVGLESPPDLSGAATAKTRHSMSPGVEDQPNGMWQPVPGAEIRGSILIP